ncbi:MAG: GGDEF domain-containing protein [Thioalkalispiraceae bacterium]
MTDNKHKSEEPILEGHGTEKALELLEELNNSAAGKIIYQQVEHILRESDHTQDKIIRGYIAIAQVLISAYRKSLPKNSLLYLELKLIQKRLNPPISVSELAVLHGYFRNATKLINEVSQFDTKLFNQALAPLTQKEFYDNPGETSDEHPVHDAPPSVVKPVQADEQESSTRVEQTIDSIYRNKLSQHHKEILDIQAKLADKVGATMRKQESFAEKLESVLEQLDYPGKNKNIEHLRNSLMNEIENILSEQGSQTQMMHDTQSFLQLIGSNIRKLSDELDQVRVLSLTDELTQLPNRRAFLRRIKDEMDRAQRDNTLLTVSIIDLDNFKEINDKHGHAVGDEMLRVYAREILSIFRRYDMVARYGGEEFAVLLPNTDKEGAERAFTKVRNKTAETFIINNNEVMHVPTFSAGLAIFSPGESPESLIERADNALYKAKQNGRDRVVFDPQFLGDDKRLQEKAIEE